MNRAAHFLFGQGDDDPFDLPPVAEAHDIALVAAVLGTRRGLEAGVVTIGLDQQRRIRKSHAAGDERHVHDCPINPPLLELWVMNEVNEAVTMKLWRQAPQSAMRPSMTNRRSPAAGGIFLFLGPVIGAVYGVEAGQPVVWMLVGFAVGVAIALAIWLVDRRKS